MNFLCLHAISDKIKSFITEHLSNVKLIVIDEISMVSNVMLLHIHNWLTHIFGTPNTLPFAGLSVHAISDLYQLPPKMRPMFADFKNALKNLSHRWRLFKMIELSQIMRQNGDSSFSHLLNGCRKGKLNKTDNETLTHRVVAKNDGYYPKDALHI